MGIVVEPVEPCYDSDCYYASGETLTWWGNYGYVPPSPPSYEPPRIDPPPGMVDVYPYDSSVGGGNVPSPPFPPPSTSSPPASPPPQTSPQPEEDSPSTQPLPPPESNDPLYRVIGSLLSSRPAPAQATPVVVQGRAVNPWPIALVGLAAVGAVAYVMARRSK